MATKALATWALALQFGSLTEPIVDMAVKSVYNWAGCAISGYALPPAGIAYEANVPFIGAEGNSSIFGTGKHVDVKNAALINGIASHADDYDDTHRDNPIHPLDLCCLLCLLLPSGWHLCQARISWQPSLLVLKRNAIGVAVFHEHYNVGWHITSTVGSALLAKSGFGGSLEGLEAKRGWSHVVSTRENLAAEISTLGDV